MSTDWEVGKPLGLDEGFLSEAPFLAGPSLAEGSFLEPPWVGRLELRWIVKRLILNGIFITTKRIKKKEFLYQLYLDKKFNFLPSKFTIWSFIKIIWLTDNS